MKRAALQALGIAALSVLPFLAALHFELVWDDPLLLSQVARVGERDGAAGLFATDFRLYADRSMGFYRPLTSLSLWVQIQEAWRDGGEDALPGAALPLHAANLLLHAGCSVLVWLLLRRLVGGGWVSWLGAAIFAVHPVHVEPAVFIAARTDLLAALGVLGSLGCWIEGLRAGSSRPRLVWWVAGAALALLAALAKEQALLLPAVLVLWSFLLQDSNLNSNATSRRRDWIALWLFAVAAALLLRWQLAHVGFGPKETLANTGGLTWFFRLGLPALLLYFKLWLAPWPLNSYYTAAQVAVGWASVAALAGIVVLAGIAYRNGRGRAALAALGFTLVFLLPVLHLAPLHGAAASERFLYLPSVGLAMLVALALAAMEQTKPARVASRSVACAVIVVCVVLSVLGTRPWQSNATLFARAVETSPNAYGGHYGLARVFAKAGRHDDAIREYRETIRLMPDFVDAYVQLGIESTKMSDFAGARAALEEALRLEPQRTGIYTNLGVLAMKEGSLDEAIRHFSRAAELDPRSPLVHYNLGLAMIRAGDDEGARREVEVLERLDRDRAARLRAEMTP